MRDGNEMMNATTMESSTATATILAIDLGKFRSVACEFDPSSGEHTFQTIATTPSTVHDLLIGTSPKLLVIEACNASGWISDLAESLSIEVRAANTLGEAWKRKRVKRKTTAMTP